jgi:hypothetical protein
MSRSRLIANGLNGAGIGIVFGILALGYVVVARLLIPGIHDRLGLSLLTLALLYLVAAPGLGFLAGVARTWLPGRLGSTIIAAGVGAAATAIVIPLHPNTRTPWGPVEYFAILLMAVMSGIFIGAKHR